jgi:DtxR family Mn-dependent transcriptional regulator
MEDYLEAIYHLTRDDQCARTTAIATYLGVQPASTTEMLQKLADKHLIIYKKYEGARLTSNGLRLGKAVSEKHSTIFGLLTMLQIPADIADRDACTMEHNLDPVTITQLKKFVSFVDACPDPPPHWLKHFQTFSCTGRMPRSCQQAPSDAEDSE